MNSLDELKSIGLKTVFWLLFQTLLAATVTVALALLTNLGKDSTLSFEGEYIAKEIPPFTQVITDLFSNNIFKSMADGKLIPVVFFAIIIGIASVSLNSSAPEIIKPFKDLITAMHKIINKIVDAIIGFLPFAIVAFLANTVAKNDLKSLMPLMMVIVLTFISCFIHTYITGGLLIAFVAKLNPIKYFKKILPAQTMAFTTQSSSGTIPVYVHCITKKVGVSSAIANFVSSIGTTVGMAGCAGVWPTLLAIFAYNALGMDLSFIQCATLIILTPIVSLGTAGVPGGGVLLATAMFIILGLPLEFVGIFAGIDALVDMARTTANVSSSMTSATLVAKSERQLDEAIFNE